ncbi:hypothetical protein Btru_053738 [Bulinus truncatus]|nr:hypothetical protein Btru_053738 [Bulinus truncatus]
MKYCVRFVAVQSIKRIKSEEMCRPVLLICVFILQLSVCISAPSKFVVLNPYKKVPPASGCSSGVVAGKDYFLLTGKVNTSTGWPWRQFLRDFGFEIEGGDFGTVCSVHVTRGSCGFSAKYALGNTCYCSRYDNGHLTLNLNWTFQLHQANASFFLWWGQKNFERSASVSFSENIIDPARYLCLRDKNVALDIKKLEETLQELPKSSAITLFRMSVNMFIYTTSLWAAAILSSLTAT